MNGTQNIQINQSVHQISNWQTDVVSIDHYHCSTPTTSSGIHIPHTIFLFVPGNPGCVGWYIDMLYHILEKMGVGYAARGISYAGHGVGRDKIEINEEDNDSTTEKQPTQVRQKQKAKIAFTVDGQVEHKIEWVDMINSEMISLHKEQMGQNNNHNNDNNHPQNSDSGFNMVKFVFITHSIGAHLVQRMLLLRRDVLFQTRNIIHITPFFRFDPESWMLKQLLAMVGNAPKQAIFTLQSIMYLLSFLPPKLIDLYMEKVASMPQAKDRQLAIDLYSQPPYIRNFLNLGTEEIREVPEIFDLPALQIIGESCPTSILYSPNQDHWAPLFHMEEIIRLKKEGSLPANITAGYDESIVHGFVVFPEMVQSVVDFVVKSMALLKDANAHVGGIQSKL